MRRTSCLALKAWIIAVAVGAVLISIVWGAAVVGGPSACHLALFEEKIHIAAGEGRLILCRFVSGVDVSGNVIPEVTNCRAYRGEPPIVHCIAGSTAGFHWNYCKFSSFIELSLILPIGPFLALLVVSAVGANSLRRRLTIPAHPPLPTPSVTDCSEVTAQVGFPPTFHEG